MKRIRLLLFILSVLLLSSCAQIDRVSDRIVHRLNPTPLQTPAPCSVEPLTPTPPSETATPVPRPSAIRTIAPITPHSNDSTHTYSNHPSSSIIAYFNEIALGTEFGDASLVVRKWKDPMTIYIKGQPSDALRQELDRIVDELNCLIDNEFFITFTENENLANYVIFFGSDEAYAEMHPELTDLIEFNWGLFTIYWDGQENITNGYMYVDIYRCNDRQQKHVLREELTQSLGLAQDSLKYEESIFQSDWTETTEYMDIDKDLIHLLYQDEVTVGMTAEESAMALSMILNGNRYKTANKKE